jgi:hypothetical protein
MFAPFINKERILYKVKILNNQNNFKNEKVHYHNHWNTNGNVHGLFPVSNVYRKF